ncbi:MAG: response regulator transcription factor [Actinomycetia bacterium]|nr:response regulator transcription factor [Actinomycetes bacterium]
MQHGTAENINSSAANGREAGTIRPIGVALLDDHELMRIGLAQALGGDDRFRVVESTDDPTEIVNLLAQRRVDLVVVDMDLLNRLPAEMGEHFASKTCEMPVLFLADSCDHGAIIESIQSGASGFVHKRSSVERVRESVHRLAHGERVIDPMLTEAVFDHIRQARTPGSSRDLTRRDLELLSALVESKTNREIAAQLYLSEKTVKNNLTQLFRKLGVQGRAEAAELGARLYAGRLA